MNEIFEHIQFWTRAFIAASIGLVVVSLASCHSAHSSVDKTETITIRDTVLHTILQQRIDSIYRRDSVYIIQRGDTIYHNTYHETLRLIDNTLHDTLYVYQGRDTVMIEKQETVVENASGMKLIDKLMLLVAIAMVAAVIVMWLKYTMGK